MSEPDKNGFHLDSMALGGPVSILFLMFSIALFQMKNNLPYFNLILWVVFPLIAYIIAFLVNLISQNMSCHTIDTGKAAIGGIPVIISMLIGIGISSISYCRIPVASVFAPLFIGESMDIVKNNSNATINNIKNSSKKCCTPKITLETVERNYPIVQGLDYGFYIMFSILFGFVMGNSVATIC